MCVESKIMPTSVLVLRLHSIFAYLVFAFFTFKIAEKLTKSTALVIDIWLICNLNPFLLDFFSLARGYGMACAFLVASVFFVLENRWRTAFIFAGLATFSNFTFLHFFNAILALYIIQLWLLPNDKQPLRTRIFKDFRSWFFVPIIYVVVLYFLHIIKQNGDLEYGGRYDLGADTLKTLIDGFLYFKTLPIESFKIGRLLFIIILLMQCLTVFYFHKNKKILPLNLIFALTVDAMLSVFYMFKIPLPIDRTALLLYPLGILATAELALLLPEKAQIPLFLPVTALFIFHFIQTANLSYCYNWRFNADIETINKTIFIPRKFKNIGTGNCMDGSTLNYYNQVQPAEFSYKMPLVQGLNPDFNTKILIENLKTYDAVWINSDEKAILDEKGIVAKNIQVFPGSKTVVMWGF